MNLRIFSKFVCYSTLLLIFAGGLVTSTGSGLSVPDWPLSYGTLFPPMVGGVRFEHTHRMIAATVGILTLILTIWINRREARVWVKRLSIFAVGAVIAQGLLGGITVLFFLPKPVSILHAILAQTFFILTVILAYSQSLERKRRENQTESYHRLLIQASFVVVVAVYCQLILGASMRHTASGLAIPDFPLAAGHLIPPFDDAMLKTINNWRFMMNLDPVVMGQVAIHFVHRIGALLIVLSLAILTYVTAKSARDLPAIIIRNVAVINLLVLLQITLGAMTVWSVKQPLITTLHVTVGAAVLGMSVLLFLRVCPLKFEDIK